MALARRNKALFIDKEAIFALLLCKEGLLYPVVSLMNQQEMQEVDSSGIYNKQSFPFSFILAPSGKRNLEVMKNAKKGEIISLVCDNQVCGELCVDTSFPINKKERLFKIMNGDIYSQKANDIYNRLGDYAICGEYTLELDETLYENRASKAKILEKKSILDAKKITSIVIEAAPITRIHERIFRSILEESDLLILLLSKPHKEEFLEFNLRKECLEFVVSNFLPKERILIFCLEDIYLFAGAHGLILDAILAQNLSCTHLVVGENHPNLSIYYDNQKIHSIYDTIKDIDIKIKLLNEFVFCNECKTIVSVRTCPHGKHHHITYSTKFLKQLLNFGLMPPTVLVRKEISAKILSRLYPKRFDGFLDEYASMFASDGILKRYSDEDFYIKLMNLYQTYSLY
ncbi:sulfate adenylyltransferase [Helicobacter valdiviensis]|uniref:Sulfate adenylyltransferase n=1 Tax=Helicobacter valdiviensis TaxID=1458358 RepID=A0A2W6MYB5_9HELI|nr:sulfate adenylyltransferase [Helicobacter valdiviensis]PZT49099.1 sulfate adenylyltransferase [Helicobacter valdiviensis]